MHKLMYESLGERDNSAKYLVLSQSLEVPSAWVVVVDGSNFLEWFQRKY
jgi:hypothetical protein